MSVSISSLARSLETRPVTLSNGQTIQVRALSVREADTIQRIFDRPIAPLVRDPRDPSAPLIVNEQEIGYQTKLRQWYRDLQRAEVCVAAGLTPQNGGAFDLKADDSMNRAYFAACFDELADCMTTGDIDEIAREAFKATKGEVREGARETATKN